jgi:hypothetical protein
VHDVQRVPGSAPTGFVISRSASELFEHDGQLAHVRGAVREFAAVSHPVGRGQTGKHEAAASQQIESLSVVSL